MALCTIDLAQRASSPQAPTPSVDYSTLVLTMVKCLSFVTNGNTVTKPNAQNCPCLPLWGFQKQCSIWCDFECHQGHQSPCRMQSLCPFYRQLWVWVNSATFFLFPFGVSRFFLLLSFHFLYGRFLHKDQCFRLLGWLKVSFLCMLVMDRSHGAIHCHATCVTSEKHIEKHNEKQQRRGRRAFPLPTKTNMN